MRQRHLWSVPTVLNKKTLNPVDNCKMSWRATCSDEIRITAHKSCRSSFIWAGCIRRQFLVSRKVTRRDHEESGSGQISLNQVAGYKLPTFLADWGLTVWQWWEEDRDVDILGDNRISRLYVTVVKARTSLGHTRKSGAAKSRKGLRPGYKKHQCSTRVPVTLLMHVPAGRIQTGIDVQTSG